MGEIIGSWWLSVSADKGLFQQIITHTTELKAISFSEGSFAISFTTYTWHCILIEPMY